MAANSRGKNYSDDELKQLCSSVLHISQDPCVGNGQRADKFWDRVCENYEAHKPRGTEVRGKKSLEGKWGDVKHDVSKFVGCIQQVEGRQVSGTNDADTFQAAKELYKANHKKNKNFTYEACYWILKDIPRFCNPSDDMLGKGKNKRNSSGKGGGSTMDAEVVENEPAGSVGGNAVDGDGDSPNVSFSKRPKGNKCAKEELRKHKQQEDVLRATTLAQTEMATANSSRAQTMHNNSVMALLSMDTENMSPDLQDFMNSWKLEEAMKLKTRMQMQHRYAEKLLQQKTNQPVDLPPSVRRVAGTFVAAPSIVAPSAAAPSVVVHDLEDDEEDNQNQPWSPQRTDAEAGIFSEQEPVRVCAQEPLLDQGHLISMLNEVLPL